MTTPVLQVKKPKHKQVGICLKTQRRLSTPLRLGTLLEAELAKEDLGKAGGKCFLSFLQVYGQEICNSSSSSNIKSLYEVLGTQQVLDMESS